MSAWTCQSTNGKAARLFHLVLESHDGRAPGADSEEKHEPVSDIDTVVVDLKALDPDGRLEKRKSIHDLPMSQNWQQQRSRRTQPGRQLMSRQFAFTPVALTKAAFMLSSFLICASSFAGVRTSGSTPIVVSCSCTWGACMAFIVWR
jgi:hypothetical protein